ncbi:multidrug effflux MFS transporter [Nakamurella multipartita]|uniref:Drug resistance transporter, Bcr/CflA subfamily n=1 Tax=Nakamurella multipartita (strain ATCC 700099 / DSM 44233 / CIP 104796 / JCM 9543 / NBRC 105858 / Y-104) TaxID=479431 RepID=C8X9W3_NAKMY|nr:multidrug effflux MFS transporter [Nakamurella multipartita]ACV81163.1 drug resistance transporter, Bcr/CflA subfamily [Nakamurella multipartita DSM 44233]
MTVSVRESRIPASLIMLLGALTAIGPFTIDLYLAAFPQITSDLATDPAAVQLTITATLAGLALGQLVIGSVSDALGRRRPLLVALSVYVVASAGIVFAGSVEMLTGLRFVQGFTAAAGMVLSTAIIRDRFHGVRVGKALARMMLVVGVAPAIAPVIGAQFLAWGSWRMMFAALAVVGAVLLVLAAVFLRESLPVERRRAGGLGAAARSYASLLRDPVFVGLAFVGGFSLAGIFTYVSSATFVFQEGFGLSTGQFAAIFASGAVAITAGTQINGALIGRVRPERILLTGVLVSVLTAAALLTVSILGLGVLPIAALLVLTLLTAGILLPAVPVIALAQNAHRAGSAAALLGAIQFAVGAFIAPLSGLFDASSPVPMAGVILGAALVTLGLVLLLRRPLAARPVLTGDERVLATSDELVTT